MNLQVKSVNPEEIINEFSGIEPSQTAEKTTIMRKQYTPENEILSMRHLF